MDIAKEMTSNLVSRSTLDYLFVITSLAQIGVTWSVISRARDLETQIGQKILKILDSDLILRTIWLPNSSGTPQKLSSLFWAKTDNLWIGAKKVEIFFFKISMVPSIEQWVLFQKKSKSDQCFISIKSCWRGRSQEGTNPAIGLRAKRTGVGCSINNPTITSSTHSSHKKVTYPMALLAIYGQKPCEYF